MFWDKCHKYQQFKKFHNHLCNLQIFMSIFIEFLRAFLLKYVKIYKETKGRNTKHFQGTLMLV